MGFTNNAPYSAPFTFQATLSNGQTVEGQAINSMYDGASGTLSVSSAYTADDGADNKSKGISPGEIAAVLICSVLALCVLGMMSYMCYWRRTKVIAAGVEDDEVGVIGDKTVVEEQGGGYDMTPIGDGNGQKTGGVQSEEKVMIEVPVSETR